MSGSRWTEKPEIQNYYMILWIDFHYFHYALDIQFYLFSSFQINFWSNQPTFSLPLGTFAIQKQNSSKPRIDNIKWKELFVKLQIFL